MRNSDENVTKTEDEEVMGNRHEMTTLKIMKMVLNDRTRNVVLILSGI